MQIATRQDGLRPAPSSARRTTISALHNASGNTIKDLEAMWANRTPQEAHDGWSKPCTPHPTPIMYSSNPASHLNSISTSSPHPISHRPIRTPPPHRTGAHCTLSPRCDGNESRRQGDAAAQAAQDERNGQGSAAGKAKIWSIYAVLSRDDDFVASHASSAFHCRCG
jgi:hypothetical protein